MSGGGRLLAAVGASLALTALGIATEATGVFPRLRFAIQRTPELSPSSLAMPSDEVVRGVPSVSLYVAPKDLYDPATGMLAHKLQRGRQWERQGWISFFDGGRLTFSGSAGVRVHGGGSRWQRFPQGYRLYFRRAYGARELPAGVAFQGEHAHPLQRLIIHNDVRQWDYDRSRWHLINPLAYDIAHAIGGITPATRPVRFFLNGEFQGVFVLTEHFDAHDYFATHWGHPVTMEDKDLDALFATVSAISPMRMRELAPLVDLDNLTRWFIATVFCATSDAFQGPGQFMDPTRKTAPWFWVNWDMDQSLHFPEHDTFASLLELDGVPRGRRANEPRARILTGLLRDDPEYRVYFERTWVDVMNFVLTPRFLAERYAHYVDEAFRLGIRDIGYLPRVERFLKLRPALVRAQAEGVLGTGPSVRVRTSEHGRPIDIDGHLVAPGWEGYYFPGMEVHLETPATAAGRVVRWRVNGRDVPGSDVVVTVDRDTTIEAIWN